MAWTADEKRAFLTQQFTAQHYHYHEHYHQTSFDVVLVDGVAAGRLYVARWESEVRIVDIALLPEFRGMGVGTRLLRALLDQARERGVPVTIHVESLNPAMRLYRRLGFQPVSTNDVYTLMEWRPQPKTAS